MKSESVTGNRRQTFREHRRKAGLRKRHKTGGGGGFRKGLMEKMTFEVLFGGWRTFPQMEERTWVPGCFTERDQHGSVQSGVIAGVSCPLEFKAWDVSFWRGGVSNKS